MNEYLLKLDQALKPFLQRNIKFTINNQQYKEGKFILYTHGYFSLNFNIRNHRKNKTETLKIPLPFNFEHYLSEGLIYFDYRIKTFAHNIEIEQTIKDIKKVNLSRYYDKILTIESL